MTFKGHNALWSGMFQTIIGHISETVQDSAKVTINHK